MNIQEHTAVSEVTTKIGLALFFTFCIVAPFAEIADILIHI